PLPRARPRPKAEPEAAMPPRPEAQSETRPAPKPRPPAPKPARKTPKSDDGPDLPWPCWLVRLHAAGKTVAQLEAEGRANNIVLTPKQRRQAQACLNAK